MTLEGDALLLTQLIIVFVCLALSAFFSSSETALTSLSPTKTRQLIDSKVSAAKYLTHWFRDPGKMLTTILIGNNLVNIIATSLTTVIAETLFASNGVAIAVGVMTFMILTFSEILPKVFARVNAVKLVLLFIRFLMVFYYLFYPFTIGFMYLTKKLFGQDNVSSGRKPLISFKDLEFFISLAKKEGSLTGQKGMIIEAVSEFNDLQIGDIMLPQHKTVSIEENISVQSLLDLSKETKFSRFPVKDEDGNYKGILHIKDVLFNNEECEKENSIKNFIRTVPWLNEYMKINVALEFMKRKKSHMCLVKDEYNQFSGIITMEDIIEEIVGEIEDEHDPQTASTIFMDDKIFVSGDEPLHDLNDKYNLELPEDRDFKTLNGYLLDEFSGVLPDEDTIVVLDKCKIRIIEINNNNVIRVEIIPD